MFGLLLIAPVRAENGVEKATKAIQSTWTVVEAEKDGQVFDRIKEGTLTSKDATFVIKTKGGSEIEGDSSKAKPSSHQVDHFLTSRSLMRR